MIFIGIDPGVGGGIAILGEKAKAVPMPRTARSLWEILKEYGTPEIRKPGNGATSYAILEKVGGVVASTAHRKFLGASMFTFGRSYGICYMALVAARIPFNTTHSRTWQKEFKVRSMKGESRSQWKGRLKELAQSFFPGVKVTLATADALLLAEYARRKRTGILR